MLTSLIQACRQLEGEVDTALLRQGFLVLDQMREEESRESSPGAARKHTPGDNLEDVLVAESARVNFDATMRYLEPMPDPRFFRLLMQIVNALHQH